MNIGNILLVAILIIFGYVMYSYINSYNEIVNELKKIRLKCINGGNKNSSTGKKSNKNSETENEEETGEEENQKNISNKFEIIPLKNTFNKKIINKNKLLINTNGEDDNDDEGEEDTSPIKNESEVLDFHKLSNKKNNSYSQNNYKNKNLNIDNKHISNEIENVINTEDESEYEPILENFQNFKDQSNIEYWKPYVENIDKVSEGFISCPYRGYNKELYEPLTLDSNTIKIRGKPKDNRIVNYNQINNNPQFEENSGNKWCVVDKIQKKCVEQNGNEICKNKQIYDTQFECQGYTALNNK